MKYVVTNVSEAREVANYFGIPIPHGRGKFPIVRLAESLEAMGNELDYDNYIPSSQLAPNDPVYQVSALVCEVINDEKVVVPRTATVSLSRVREFHNIEPGRGRPSMTMIAATVISDLEWDVFDARSIRVS